MRYAEILYEQLDTIEKINSLIQEFENEKLHLDFKGRVPNALAGGWDTIREHLAKALSGFSNADGGVLVLGVGEARDGGLRTLEPYENAQTLSQKILEQVSRLTDPHVGGVLSKVIVSDHGANAGLIIVLIPKSDSGPHQHVKERAYYQRAGESHIRMAHFQIADLFGRRPQPSLAAEVVFIIDVNERDSFLIQLQLKNLGAGIAKYPFIVIESFGAFSKRPHFTPWLQPDQFLRRKNAYSGGVDKVIHSGTSVPILQFCNSFASIGDGAVPGGTFTDRSRRLISGEFGCENAATRKFELEIPIEELIRFRDEETYFPKPILSQDI